MEKEPLNEAIEDLKRLAEQKQLVTEEQRLNEIVKSLLKSKLKIKVHDYLREKEIAIYYDDELISEDIIMRKVGSGNDYSWE